VIILKCNLGDRFKQCELDSTDLESGLDGGLCVNVRKFRLLIIELVCLVRGWSTLS
jgi:hypothetical protein